MRTMLHKIFLSLFHRSRLLDFSSAVDLRFYFVVRKADNNKIFEPWAQLKRHARPSRWGQPHGRWNFDWRKATRYPNRSHVAVSRATAIIIYHRTDRRIWDSEFWSLFWAYIGRSWRSVPPPVYPLSRLQWNSSFLLNKLFYAPVYSNWVTLAAFYFQ